MKKYVIILMFVLLVISQSAKADSLSQYNKTRLSCISKCTNLINAECVKACPPVKYVCPDGTLITADEKCPGAQVLNQVKPATTSAAISPARSESVEPIPLSGGAGKQLVAPVAPTGFWGSIASFFKRLFGF